MKTPTEIREYELRWHRRRMNVLLAVAIAGLAFSVLHGCVLGARAPDAQRNQVDQDAGEQLVDAGHDAGVVDQDAGPQDAGEQLVDAGPGDAGPGCTWLSATLSCESCAAAGNTCDDVADTCCPAPDAGEQLIDAGTDDAGIDAGSYTGSCTANSAAAACTACGVTYGYPVPDQCNAPDGCEWTSFATCFYPDGGFYDQCWSAFCGTCADCSINLDAGYWCPPTCGD
jgi:hypothetical protein